MKLLPTAFSCMGAVAYKMKFSNLQPSPANSIKLMLMILTLAVQSNHVLIIGAYDINLIYWPD